MPIIEVNNVTKEYQLGQLQSLKDTLLRGLARITGKKPEEKKRFKALDNVSFTIEQGEIVGIIGQNGAGKSTLLKILSQITTPTQGEVHVNGKIAPLIEVGAGLVPDLTGRENIYLNATILGMKKKEIEKRLDEIIDFAELADFIDTPIKRYSSGMKVRLGFSIATSIDAPILIVDEVLAVGDLAFQRKCFDRMENMIKHEGKTVLLVSHNIRQVERMCTRVLVLDHGSIEEDGDPHSVCDLFYAKSDKKIQANAETNPKGRGVYSSDEINLISIKMFDSAGRETTSIPYTSNLSIVLSIQVQSTLDTLTFGIGIHTTDFVYLSTHNSEQQLTVDTLQPGLYDIRFQICNLPLLPGVYGLRAGITTGSVAGTLFYGENLLHFTVTPSVNERLPSSMRQGFFVLDGNWKLEKARNIGDANKQILI